jgi:hypothetical protein
MVTAPSSTAEDSYSSVLKIAKKTTKSKIRKHIQLAIVDADVLFEWIRLATTRKTNSAQYHLFRLSMWLDGRLLK